MITLNTHYTMSENKFQIDHNVNVNKKNTNSERKLEWIPLEPGFEESLSKYDFKIQKTLKKPPKINSKIYHKQR